jgi:hypothetical protein
LGSYVYAGGEVIHKVFQYDPSDMSKVAESPDYGGSIRGLTRSDYTYTPVVGLENKSGNIAAKMMAGKLI